MFPCGHTQADARVHEASVDAERRARTRGEGKFRDPAHVTGSKHEITDLERR